MRPLNHLPLSLGVLCACTGAMKLPDAATTTAPLRIDRPVTGSRVGSNILLEGACVMGLPLIFDSGSTKITSTCQDGVFAQRISVDSSVGEGSKQTITVKQEGSDGRRMSWRSYYYLKTTNPNVTVTTPTEEAWVWSGDVVFQGDCESDLDVYFTYDSGSTGPSTAPCVNGQYSINVTLSPQSVPGHAVSASQHDGLGHSALVARAVNLVPKDQWQLTSSTSSPTARTGATVVWSGKEVYLWGGTTSENDPPVYAYRPGLDSWRPLRNPQAPATRTGHSAVWTGSRMIVWGGKDMLLNLLSDGSSFDPSSNQDWAKLPTAPLVARSGHVAVWTGTEMIVWGGQNATGSLGDGARYNPTTNTWTRMSSVGAPSPRIDFSYVWTGDRFVVWGGRDALSSVADAFSATGAYYDPKTDTWTPLPTVPSGFEGRFLATAVWTGSEMIVWGGAKQFNPIDVKSDGAAWSPSSGWRMLPAGGPSGRVGHVAAWDGYRMTVWGGVDASRLPVSDSAAYKPGTNAWAGMAVSPLVARESPVFTSGDKFTFIWGGFSGASALATGALYFGTDN